ncbi:MAG: glycosyltransferase family 2 protein [Microbacteriaceae bacterium]
MYGAGRAGSPAPVDATVVIVNWRQPELTVAALESLAVQSTSFSFEIIVVENEARPGSDAAIAERFPEVGIIRLPANEGFAGGVNAGIRASRGKYIVLLNNDAVADEGFLQAGIARLEQSPSSLAAIAARVLLAGRYSPVAVRDDPGALVDAAGIGWMPDSGSSGVELTNSTGVSVSRDLNGYDRDWLVPSDEARDHVDSDPFGFSGAAAFIRRAALDEVGLLDERFFMYYEDLDLSWRFRLAGYSIGYEEHAVVRHRHAASSGHHSALVRFHSMRNRLLTVVKNGTALVILRVLARTLGRMLRDSVHRLRGGRQTTAVYLSRADWLRLWAQAVRLGGPVLSRRVATAERGRARSRRLVEKTYLHG